MQDFLRNYQEDGTKLAFSGSKFPGISTRELLEQLEGRRRIRKKLPRWFESEKIYYPPKINLEQCSSEVTARYKSELFSGDKAVDLTGGFGVDSYYLSLNFKEVIHYEINPALAEIVRHNFKQLGSQNIALINSDGTAQIKSIKADLIYVDPSRRHEKKGKVILLEDCEPDLTVHLESLMDAAKNVMVKLSPMFDISLGIRGLKYVREVHVVAVNNEVKELLFVLHKDNQDNTRMKAINLSGSQMEMIDFDYGESIAVDYSAPLQFLYEPNAAIMKSGGFAIFGDRFGVKKLGAHTHLFTSEALVECPARRFRVIEVMPYSKNEMKLKLKGSKGNISVRNFPMTVDEIRKKWKISDGGNRYLFFTTVNQDSRMVIITEKVS